MPRNDGPVDAGRDGGDLGGGAARLSAWRLGARPLLLFGALGVAFLWSYWPTIGAMIEAWTSEPDYSHGFLVLPIAIWFLWVRRDSFPRDGVNRAIVSGLVAVGLSAGMRWLGGLAYLESMDAWSMLLWLAGIVLLLGGWKVLAWSSPSLAFLWFMIPMPFVLESALRQPLQRIATVVSCGSLRILGWPAFAEANVIRMGETRLGVEEACSGLRIFVGIAALAFAYVVLVRRPWWIKALLLLSVLPITLIANSTRIVVTCILYEQVSGEAAHRFSHDTAGLVMIPFAAALFGLLLWYLSALVRQERVASLKELVQSSASAT
jgi:exosortase